MLKCNGADKCRIGCPCAREHEWPFALYGTTLCTDDEYCQDAEMVVKCVEV